MTAKYSACRATSTGADLEAFGPSITMTIRPLSPLPQTCSPATQTESYLEKCGIEIILPLCATHTIAMIDVKSSDSDKSPAVGGNVPATSNLPLVLGMH